jgi:hypothetical protein
LLSGLTGANDGSRYRCHVTGITSADSDAATLTVNESVTVNSNPNPQTVCASGGAAVFNVGVTGGVASYQWQYSSNGTDWNDVADNLPTGATYTGAASASLVVNTTAATPVATHLYRVVVNAAAPCSSAASDAAALDVNGNATTCRW